MPSDKSLRSRHLKRGLSVLVGLLLALAAALAWLLGTGGGARTAFSLVSSLSGNAVQAEGVDGRLMGALHADHLVVDTAGQHIVLDGVNLDWKPSALLRRELHILFLRADALSLMLKPSKEPASLPKTLELPIKLQADDVALRRGSVKSAATELLSLGETALKLAYDGVTYRLQLARLAAQSSSAQNNVTASLNGEATLGAVSPFALHATLTSGAEAAVAGQNLNASGQIKIDGSLAEMAVSSDLVMGQASVAGNAVVRPFSTPLLGVASLRAQAVNLAAFRSDLPETALNLALSVKEDGSGRLTIDNPEAGLYDEKQLPVVRLLLAFRQSQSGYSLDQIVASLGAANKPAGEITGKGEIAGSNLSLSLATQMLDLRKLDRRARSTRLTGRADFLQREGRQEFTLNLGQPLQKNKLAIAAHAILADQILTVDRLGMQLGEGSVEAKARVALNGRQEFDVSGSFSKFRSRDLGNFPNLPDVLLNGEFAAQGTRQPTLTTSFRFGIRDSLIAGQALQGEGKGELRNGRLNIEKMSLAAGDNRLEVQGRLDEEKGNLTFSLHAPKLELLGPGFGGAFDLNGTAIGTFTAPRIEAEWHGSNVHLPQILQFDTTQGKFSAQLDRRKALLLNTATVDASLRGLRSNNRQVDDVSLQAQFSPQPNSPLDVALHLRGLRVGNAAADSLDIAARGSTGSHVLELTLAAPGQTLAMTANGALSKLESDPQWQGSLQRVDGTGALTAHLARPVPLLVSRQRVQLDNLRLESSVANVEFDQFVRDANGIISRGRIEHLQLQRVLAFASTAPALSTDLVLSATWDLHLGDVLNGKFSLRRDSGDVVMRGSAPVALRLRTLEANGVATNGEVSLQARLEGERAGRIVADIRSGVVRNGGRVEMSPDAPLSGNIRGDLPSIGWLASLISPDLLLEGRLQTTVDLRGTVMQPDLTGRIEGRGLRALFVRTGVDLRDGVLDGEFRGSRLQINALRFGPAGKDAVASGFVDFAEGKPSAQFNLKTNQFALFDRSDRRIVISGSSDVAWSDKIARIIGTFKTDSGFIDITSTDMPQLADDVVIVGKNKSDATAPRGLPAHIDVGIGLGEGIALKGRGLDARLGGNIRLQSEPGEPLHARGTLGVTKGTFTAYGRELDIERGLLRFNGPIDNPGLDILAMRRGQQVEAGVNVGGTALAPRVTLVSEPSVSDADKLSWLVLGRALNDSSSGSGDIAALQQAAGSLLSQGSSAGVQSRIAQTFGLDELKVGTDTQSTLQERVVTIGKRISSKLYVSLEQGIETTTSVLRLRYTLSQKLTVEAGTGTRSTILLFYNIAYD